MAFLTRVPSHIILLLGAWFSPAAAQIPAPNSPVAVTIVDENNLAVSGAEVVVRNQARAAAPDDGLQRPRNLFLERAEPYSLRVQKAGFYASTVSDNDPATRDMRIVLNHEQMVVQQVNVTASVPGIDPEQVSDELTMDLPEIVNIPYPTSRDIRNLLPFYPGVVPGLERPDSRGRLGDLGDTGHAGRLRYPLAGQRRAGHARQRRCGPLHRSGDHSLPGRIRPQHRRRDRLLHRDGRQQVPLQRHRLHSLVAPGQRPSVRQVRSRVSRFPGPLVRNRAWFFDGLELEYDNIYIAELPANADTNHLIRGSNLFRVQVNATPAQHHFDGLLFNDYHSPYDGISSLVPQQSTTKRDTIAWLPYVRDQHSFPNGALLDAGVGVVRFRDGYEPHGNSPFELTPELPRAATSKTWPASRSAPKATSRSIFRRGTGRAGTT